MAFSFGSSRRRAVLALALVSGSLLPVQAMAQNIVGRVTDSTETRSLQAVEIELVELQRTATTNRDGSFHFNAVPAGTYTLIARYTSAEPTTQKVTVPASGEVRADLRVGAELADAILVVGQRANLASSLSRQRAAEGVTSVLSRDAIGQFPDQNVAEAIRRAPGINVLNDQGEGRFVSVRGLSPDLNSTSINGNRVMATGGGDRAAALDVIPSELVEAITIKKSLTPDMDGDALGGSIEIETTTAFSRNKPYLGISLEGSYSDLRDAVSPKGGIDFTLPVSDSFGIAGGLSYSKRRFSSDNIEAADWNVADDGTVYAETLEYRDYDVTRERLGASLSFDLRASDTTELYVRGLYSKFDDTEARRRLVFKMDEAPESGTDTTATFNSADGRIEVRRDLKDRGEWQEIKTVSVGGKTELENWKFVYDAAWSQAAQSEANSVDPIRFRQRFTGEGALGVTFDYSDPSISTYAINFGEARFNDASRYSMTLLERTTSERARDEEFSFRGDITRSIPLTNGDIEIQAGTKIRLRDKSQAFGIDIFDGYDGDLTLADMLGKQSYGLADMGPVPSIGALHSFLDANGYTNFERNALESDFASAMEDYSAKEDIYAGYLLGRYSDAKLRVVGGVRMEHTENQFAANRGDVNYDDETLTITPVAFSRSYTDWLPSLNLRFEPQRDLVLRAAGYKSVVRPKISSVVPRFIVEENEDGDRQGEFGNPDLQPYSAWNFDASAEFYFARDAAISFGAFYKSIDNFIVVGEYDDVTFNGITVDEGVIPMNGEKATVKGLEFSYQQAYTFLPAPFDGLLTNFNYTFTDAEGQLANGELTDGRYIPLPSSSKHTFNAVLGYEKGPLSLRAAGAYRSGYLDEIGGEADEDRYVANHFQLDLTAKYRLNDNFQLIAEWVNVLDEPYNAYQNGPVRRNLIQYEEYGSTVKFGVRGNF